MNKNKKMRTRGFGTIELLASLFISACICAIAYPAMHVCIKNYYNISNRIEETSRLFQIINVIQRGLDAKEALFGLPAIWTHPTGGLSNVYGESITQNELSQKILNNINPTSNAVSIRTLDSKNIYLVISQDTLGNKITLRLCGNNAPNSNIDNWLAISVDGHTAIKGHLVRASISSLECANLQTLKGVFEYITDPVFSSSQNLSPQTWQLRTILPITDAFTIYLDKNETLKRAAHYSNENQPMARDIKTFKTLQISKNLLKLDLEADKLNQTLTKNKKNPNTELSTTISSSIILPITEPQDIHLLNLVL